MVKRVRKEERAREAMQKKKEAVYGRGLGSGYMGVFGLFGMTRVQF